MTNKSKYRQPGNASISGQKDKSLEKIAGLLKDRHFWLIVVILSIATILIYGIESYFLNMAPSEVGKSGVHLILMVVRSGLLLMVIGIAAWRFRVRGGFVVCIIIGLILLPHIISGYTEPLGPSFLAVYFIGATSGIAFSLLVGARRQAEEALRKSQAGLAEAQRIANVGSFEWHIKDNTSYLSDEYYRIFGLSPRVTGFTYEEFLSRVHPEDREFVKIETAESLTGNKPHDMDFRIILPDGSERSVHSEAEVILSDSGEPLREFGVVQDVTARKLVEKKLEEYSCKLEEQVEKRTAELDEQIKHRIEYSRALVHELKTPLTALISSSEMLSTNNLQDEVQKRLAKNIFRGSRSLNKRIDELLDLAKSEIGVLKIRCRLINPLKLIHEVAEDMSLAASRKGQSLILEVPKHLPLIWADKERLQQILLNLVSNAIKFNRRNGRVLLRAKEEGTSVVFDVLDEGKGISAEDMQKLFVPYYRLKSDRDRLSGLGLGLTLCKELVELHQGNIWIESEEGKGSIFSFSIPLRDHGKAKDIGEK
ncbi:ATP-binding protein [Chloroflexota bacterium]